MRRELREIGKEKAWERGGEKIEDGFFFAIQCGLSDCHFGYRGQRFCFSFDGKRLKIGTSKSNIYRLFTLLYVTGP